ncbi:ApeA N-terminal domain 1-containing protein [Streptomyces liliifuscus]|uniref:ApeA N-terminal domain-containing protein n=1 Tax=Streptomyces liliifuscus TaxID=2797636 RepID=A0A7T7I4U0_9ACTN|nr:HEPN domain-containing protein [Streptomyces liliifuscus]QQM40931.1 hypothetical protein JEQ17_16575 [Streptomyces liliifuscus]
MESFESDGLFWLPNQEEDQVAGRVSFSPITGTRLSLIGGFSETPFGDMENGPEASIIHGVAGKRFLTLIGSSRASRRFESPGFMREDYRVEYMFAGQALLAPESVVFNRVSVRFNNLYDWIGYSSVSREHVFDAQNKLVKAGLTLTPMEKIEHPADGCKISIGGVWKILGNQQNPGFEQDFSISIAYEDPVGFESIVGDVTVLQDLLTATTDAVSVPTHITLEIPVGSGEGDSKPSFVQAYGQQPAYTRVKESKPSDMVLKLKEIGDIPSVARWFNFVRGRRVVLGLMLSSKYSQMYTENKFFNAVSAAETLHRMEFPNELRPADEYKHFRRMLVRHVPKKYRSWLSQQLLHSNEPRLRDRLIELAEYADLPSVLKCDAQHWAKAVTDARNRMVHHDKGKGPGASTVELYWLAESLRLMVLLCLARFCEFQEGYVEKIRNAQSVNFLVKRVGEIMQPSDAVES